MMNNGDDYDLVADHCIGDQIGCARNNEFACLFNPPGPANVW